MRGWCSGDLVAKNKDALALNLDASYIATWKWSSKDLLLEEQQDSCPQDRFRQTFQSQELM